MDISVLHKQPAFLGEHYNVSVQIKPYPSYEITSAVATFNEKPADEKSPAREPGEKRESEKSPEKRAKSPAKAKDEEKSSTIPGNEEKPPAKKEKGQKSSSRRASVVSADSSSSDSTEWSFILYAHKAGKESVVISPENVDELLDKLPSNHYTIPSIKLSELIFPLYFQFRVEGKKNFELSVRYTARKIMHDGSYSSEFILENKESFDVNVLCPFAISCEWLAPEPSTGGDQQTITLGTKARLLVNKRATLGVKISTKGFQDVAIHDINLVLKEEGVVKLLENTRFKESKWTLWPIIIGGGEQFAATFAMLPINQFKDKQLGDVEIIWSRVNDKKGEKTICSIPIWETTSTETCIDIIVEPPLKAVKLQEFNVNVRLRNCLSATVETKVVIQESPDFLIAGELSSLITLPPFAEDLLRYTMVPLRCGRLEFPRPIVYVLVSGNPTEPVGDRGLEQYIYVFPA